MVVNLANLFFKGRCSRLNMNGEYIDFGQMAYLQECTKLRGLRVIGNCSLKNY